MNYLLLDADVWLNLMGRRKHWQILNEISDLISSEVLTLVVPEITRTEVERNQEKLRDQHAKSYLSDLKSVRQISDLLDEAAATAFRGLIGELQTRVSGLADGVDRHVKVATDLFDLPSTQTVPITEDMYATVGKRAASGEKPFTPKKNSAGDMLLLESLRAFLGSTAGDSRVYFVTCNKSDFSDTQNPNDPHPDCVQYFNDDRVFFSINIASVMEEIAPGKLPEGTVEEVAAVVEAMSLAEMQRALEAQLRPFVEMQRVAEEKLRPFVEMQRAAEEFVQPFRDLQREVENRVQPLVRIQREVQQLVEAQAADARRWLEEKTRPIIELRTQLEERARPLIEMQRALECTVRAQLDPFVEFGRALNQELEQLRRLSMELEDEGDPPPLPHEI